MSKMTLFASMAMGLKIQIVDYRSGHCVSGHVVQITLESGLKPGIQPQSWVVRLMTDDDTFNLHVRTTD